MNEYFYDKNNDTYLEIRESDCEFSPRDGCNNTTFITFEKNYYSPDKNPFNTWEEMTENFGVKTTGHMKNDLDNLMSNALKKGYVLLPIWKYEHSCRIYQAANRYPFHDRKPTSTPGYDGGWDGGLCGVIYEKRNRRNIDTVKEHLNSDVNEYNRYINNEGIFNIEQYNKDGETLDCIYDIWSESKYPSIEELANLPCLQGMDCDKNLKYIGEFNNIENAISYHKEELAKDKPLSLDEKLKQASSMRSENNNVSKDTKNKDLEI